jgi:DNA-binding LytR/AlgR family response regulator
MLKAIAIDDEPIALDVVKRLSSQIPFIELTARFTNAFKAIDYLQKEKVDLIFLDIKMPDISGIDFLKSLPSPPMIIFTTAYSEHAVQSFELDAIDYLLKPFSQPRFLKACNKALEQFELRRKSSTPVELTSLFIKSGRGQIRINLEDILYAESNGNYVQFYLEKQKIISRLSMSEAAALLPSSTFIRIHRSFIVAIKRINKIEKRSIWINQTELPIGAAYINGVENLLK